MAEKKTVKKVQDNLTAKKIEAKKTVRKAVKDTKEKIKSSNAAAATLSSIYCL